MATPRRHALVVAAGLALAGCGTTEKEGAVGDTLTSRTLEATLLAAKPRDGVYAVRMRLCRDEAGPAVNAFAFALVLDDGDELQPDALASTFGVSREGCETGVIAYRVPAGARPETLLLEYDDTGSAQPGDREEHADFRWAL